MPALVPAEDSDADIQFKTPPFPTPCDVEVQVIVDGTMILDDSHMYAFYGTSGIHVMPPHRPSSLHTHPHTMTIRLIDNVLPLITCYHVPPQTLPSCTL